MKGIGQDVLVAIVMGVVVPAAVLRAGLLILPEDTPEKQMRPNVEVVEEYPVSSDMKMLYRSSQGEVCLKIMDEYLVGAVLAEMPAEFEQEALKAQSVAARTYALKAYITGGKHGDGSVCGNYACCQAYIDETEYLERGGRSSDVEKVKQAVMDTSGYVLTYMGDLIEATYFSCSGGRTEDAVAVWGTQYPYLQSVESPGEEEAAYYSDAITVSSADIERILGVALSDIPENWIGELTFTSGGGVDTIEIGGVLFRGTELRMLLGLRSTLFTTDVSSHGITFTTRGYGHRVGMSQYGADAMALLGYSYPEILAHYYPGTTLECRMK